MAKKLITFLGTNQYVPVNYSLGETKIENCTFIQAAVAQILCRDWTSEDQFIIFLTKDAEEKNWNDSKQNNNKGLEKTLKELSLPLQVKTVKGAPEGKNESEIWKYFDLILNEIRDCDEVFFDITHGYRNLQVIALTVMNYAKALRNNVKMGGIYYGAFEALGFASEVNNMPLEERNAPIFDLTPLSAISEWSAGVNRFVETGDPSIICALTRKEMKPILAETEGKNVTAKKLKALAESLNAFYLNVVTCRGNVLTKSIKCLEQNFNDVSESSTELLPPLKPLLDRINEKIIDIEDNYLFDGINAARWCFVHNLTQQGYTILQEFIVSYLEERYFPGEKINDKKYRELFTSIAASFATPEDPKWKSLKENNQVLIDRINTDPCIKEFMIAFSKLTPKRNDMNHCGFVDGPAKSNQLIEKLLEHIEEMEKLRQSLLERDSHTSARPCGPPQP